MTLPTLDTFIISPAGDSITCELCGMTSYHPEDVRHHYCGKCHIFHDDIPKGRREPWLRRAVWSKLLARMRYKSGTEVRERDIVIGVNAAGSPVAGHVLEVNPNRKHVLIGPAIQNPVWLPAEDCLPLAEAMAATRPEPSAFDTDPEEHGEKPRRRPEREPEQTERSDPGTPQSQPEANPGQRHA